MTNVVSIVGRLMSDPKYINETTDNTFWVEVRRPYSNEKGEYDADIIPCVAHGTIVDMMKEYVKRGNLIGVKGMLQCENDELVVLVEKITFLSSKGGE